MIGEKQIGGKNGGEEMVSTVSYVYVAEISC